MPDQTQGYLFQIRLFREIILTSGIFFAFRTLLPGFRLYNGTSPI